MSKFTWFIVAIVVLVTGIIVYNKVLHPKQNGPARPAGGPPKAMSVNGFVVQPRNLDNNILASGTLLANEEVELHPEVSGKIIQLNLNRKQQLKSCTTQTRILRRYFCCSNFLRSSICCCCSLFCRASSCTAFTRGTTNSA